jgi:arylsulfatase
MVDVRGGDEDPGHRLGPRPDRRGARIDGLCQLFDLAPTILELAGCNVPESFEAQTLLPALEGRDWQPREHVFCEQAGDVNLTGTEFITMVRSKRHKLVHFKGADYGQLFDLEADPGEITNRWADPAMQATKDALLAVLRDWLIESNYRTRDWMAAYR